MEFIVSKTELIRRKKAFITLLSSMIVGLFLAASLLNYPIPIDGYLLVGAVFIFLGMITFQFLNSIMQMKIRLSDKTIERIKGKVSERYLLADIKDIRIKRRTNGIIREIYMYFPNQKELVLTAFENDFEEIKEIINRANTAVAIKETKEIIDFDHPLFYSILGLPISFGSIALMKLAENWDYSQTRIILLVFSFYAFGLGLYFILKKPTSARVGKNQAVIDYIIGLIIAGGGLFIFFAGLSS